VIDERTPNLMTRATHPTRGAGHTLTILTLSGLFAATLTPAQADLPITDLASFNGTNGDFPQAGVIFDSSGNLYGTTVDGGANGFGTVYEIAKGSTAITDIASFKFANGATPQAGVTFDSSGNLYGTTGQGGANSDGVVYEIANGSAAITDLASFNGTNGVFPQAGVTFDSSGNLYGTTVDGGANGFGTVYEIAKGSAAITDLASFNFANGAQPIGGVTFDSSGNLYGTTQNGGAYKNTNSGNLNNLGVVYEIAGAGSPVPETSSAISLGLLLLFGTGGLLRRTRSHRRSATPAP